MDCDWGALQYGMCEFRYIPDAHTALVKGFLIWGLDLLLRSKQGLLTRWASVKIIPVVSMGGAGRSQVHAVQDPFPLGLRCASSRARPQISTRW